MDTSEKRFEYDIEQHLLSNGYQQFNGQTKDGTWVHNRTHDLDKCMYMDVLCEFIEKTQPKAWERYVKFYKDNAKEKLYTRLEHCIAEQGLIHVLRDGIDDIGIHINVCYFKPESGLNDTTNALYEQNILGCTRQFRYSRNNTDTIDMVLSVNGIPVVALELKNQLKGQDVCDAKRQYKEDRSSKEFAFRLNHRFLVYFAVDLNEVLMTTQLKDANTSFVPFNMGSNGAGVNGGAGNPVNEDGYATSYLWEKVLQKDSLMNLIKRFISFVIEKEEIIENGVTKTIKTPKLIFPRYHQFDVVNKIIDDVKKKGAGINYLIEHSAGSGKSNSIAWIAYRLASLHNDRDESVFNSVIVVTNRIVLDSQLQNTINSFEHKAGLLECIDEKKHSSDM
ncbi:MAG: type I restriction endonuclease subunit R, partial [Lachnospiraceae bacterium]|nr:type I restriction endonuclease subunit R [Candidatus Darwinimomas equi]